jgi:hypothetical protein
MTVQIYDTLTATPDTTLEAEKLVVENLPTLTSPLFDLASLLRLTTIDNKPVSMCFVIPREDSSYEIYYHNWGGYSQETATNSTHHHVSYVFANVKNYLDHLGGSKFIFSSSRDEAFVLARFPNARKTEGRWYEVTVD